MRDPLERLISFRLSAQTHDHYQIEAARHGLSLSAYLRLRLEVEDSIARQIDHLRLALLDSDDSEHPESSQHSLLLELLLLSRLQATPQTLRTVHLELERQGTTPWRPTTDAPVQD